MWDTNLIFAGNFRECFQNLLNLTWEYIDTFNLHHVISTSHDCIKTWEFASTRAFSRNDTWQVMSAVTDQRCTFFYKSRDDDFAKFSVRQDFSSYRINDFNVNVIVPVMHTTVVWAADSDSWTVNLSQTVDIVNLNSKLSLDAVSHFFAPTLGANDSLF